MIDHLVLATPDVDGTAAQVSADWGVDVAPGGSHTGRGTRNALASLGAGVYLEIVGPDADQPTPDFPRPFGVDALTAPKLVAWCARPARPLAEVVGEVASQGMDLGPIAEMSRLRPDGVELHWRLTLPLLGPPHEGTLPFLIDWLDSPHPADALPAGAYLIGLHLVHPQAEVLRKVLHEIGHTRVIDVEQGPAQLSAEFRTPVGFVRL